MAEQNLGQSGRVNSAQAAEIGRILGVQLILTGSITKFSVDTKGGGFGRFRAEYAAAESNLDIRLINTDTAEIMFADAGEGKVRLGDAVNAACDANYGIVDGVLQDARVCDFEPPALTCPVGTDDASCLTAKQVEAAERIWSGARDASGEPIYPGLVPGGAATGGWSR